MTEKQFHNEILPLAGTLYRVAFYILESEAEAEDAVQETFLKLWDRKDRLSRLDNPKAFCVTMVRNICLDRLRSLSRLSFPEQLPEDSSAPAPDDMMDEKQRLNAVLEAVKALPDKQREVLILRTVEGLSYDEISERTGMNNLTMRVLLSRARASIKSRV